VRHPKKLQIPPRSPACDMRASIVVMTTAALRAETHVFAGGGLVITAGILETVPPTDTHRRMGVRRNVEL